MKSVSVTGSPKLAYRVEEAAKACGLSRSTLFLRIKEGKLKSVRVGGSRLIHATELLAFLKIGESR